MGNSIDNWLDDIAADPAGTADFQRRQAIADVEEQLRDRDEPEVQRTRVFAQDPADRRQWLRQLEAKENRPKYRGSLPDPPFGKFY